MRSTRTTTAFTALLASGALLLSACGGDEEEATSAGTDSTQEEMEMPSESPSEETSSMPSEEPMDGETGAMTDPASTLVGPGCAAYAEQVPDGAGSVEGMAQDPVATAASNNPLLTTLVSAVSGKLNPDVNLVDTLNGGEFTVFAPVDDAFAAVDPATIETLSTDAELLQTVLTYHVVPGQLGPDEVVGTQETVQGGTVEVTGSGDELLVNDASVICGGVQTANATVYLIDSVLMPSS